MTARAIASGSVSFGLVSIPVKLYPAIQGAGSSFHLLHSTCKSRLKQQYVCPADGEVVERADMVKGYPFARDQYVTFTAEELKEIEARATQAIEIAEFVPLDQIDPLYFDRPYFLGPDQGGEKAYRLLAEVLARTGRGAVARYAAHGKQHLVLLRSHDGGLVMQQLLYADEVRDFSEVPIASAELKEGEVELALQLVEQISSETFEPGGYRDEARQRLQELVRQKVAGEEIALPPAPMGQAQVIDLMEALRASLAERAATAEAEKPARRKGPRHAPRRARRERAKAAKK